MPPAKWRRTQTNSLSLTKKVGNVADSQMRKAAGITRGAIYWRFRNKTNLLQTMLARALLAGVSKQFVSDVEYGKPSVQLGLVLKLLVEIGVTMSVNIPEESREEWVKLLAKGGLPAQKGQKKREVERAATIEPPQQKD